MIRFAFYCHLVHLSLSHIKNVPFYYLLLKYHIFKPDCAVLAPLSFTLRAALRDPIHSVYRVKAPELRSIVHYVNYFFINGPLPFKTNTRCNPTDTTVCMNCTSLLLHDFAYSYLTFRC